ncbi:MAG: hypothetical protein KGI58_00450 [Patescibacteria group bacterium]|nr:hypothetical protein [Patescibacteria group bacterium]
MKNHKIIYTIIFIGIVVIIGIIVLGGNKNKKIQIQTTTALGLAGMQVGTAPWIAETDNLKERLDYIKLPALSAEGTALHIHQHLDVYIDGKSVPVPAGIGVNPMAGFISPIHTHDGSGVIHIESPKVQDFTLGQFFDIWGLKFSKEAIGGYTNDQANTLKVFVNGKEFTGDPRTIVLASHQEIVVTYGTTKELPNPMPSSYAFTEGL